MLSQNMLLDGDHTYNRPMTANSFPTGDYTWVISGNGQRRVFGATSYGSGMYVTIEELVNDEWVEMLTPMIFSGSASIVSMVMNYDGTQIAFNNGTTTRVWRYDGTWALLIGYSTGIAQDLSFSDDGNYFNERGNVHTWSGTTWNAATSTIGYTAGAAKSFSWNSTATNAVAATISGATLTLTTYTRSGTTWTVQQVITSGYAELSSSVYIRMSSDATKIACSAFYSASTGATVYSGECGFEYYTYSGTWSLDTYVSMIVKSNTHFYITSDMKYAVLTTIGSGAVGDETSHLFLTEQLDGIWVTILDYQLTSGQYKKMYVCNNNAHKLFGSDRTNYHDQRRVTV